MGRAYEGATTKYDKAIEGVTCKNCLRIKRSSATSTEKVTLPYEETTDRQMFTVDGLHHRQIIYGSYTRTN